MTAEQPNAPPEIDMLEKRFKELDKKRITAEANLTTAQNELDRLRQQAREAYGTDDLDELKRRYEEMKAENLRLRGDYASHLDEIERQLAEVEKQGKDIEEANGQ